MIEAPTKGEPKVGSQEARPTLKTIAYMTGLGVTTVSRALKDAPDIGEATKERVRQVAKQIGYRPNRAGVRLRTGKTHVISLVLNTNEEILGITSHLIYGISEIIADTPYHLVVTPYSHANDPMDPVRYVVETGAADGIIISRTEPHDQRVRYLTERGIPFVTHGRTNMGIDHAFVDFDNEMFATNAVKVLQQKGRSRLCLLGPPINLTYAHHMNLGYNSTAGQMNAQTISLDSVTVDSPIEQVAESVSQLMRSDHRPDGLVCGGASAAIGATAGIEAAGLKLGHDVDIVTKQSAVRFLRWFRPSIYVINEDFREAGRSLAKAVIGINAGDPATNHQRTMQPAPITFETNRT